MRCSTLIASFSRSLWDLCTENCKNACSWLKVEGHLILCHGAWRGCRQDAVGEIICGWLRARGRTRGRSRSKLLAFMRSSCGGGDKGSWTAVSEIIPSAAAFCCHLHCYHGPMCLLLENKISSSTIAASPCTAQSFFFV
jgi:hypothetical protein